MNQLLHLEDKIRTAGAALGRLESELPRHPASRSLRANFLSLRKLHENLQEEYEEVASELGIDLLHYKLLEDRPTARALARSIDGFQETFSMTYDARKNGPKLIRTINPDALRVSELHAAYAYPGSFGIVFTIPNRRTLFPEIVTELEQAVAQVMEIAKAGTDRNVISSAVRSLGRGTIAALYNWSKSNAQTGTGIALDWRRDGESRESSLIQPPEFAAVASSIEAAEEITREIETKIGTLVGADTQRKTFRFIADGDERAVAGKFSDAISSKQEASIPHRYRARIRKTVTRSLATEQDKPVYDLLRLEEIG